MGARCDDYLELWNWDGTLERAVGKMRSINGKIRSWARPSQAGPR